MYKYSKVIDEERGLCDVAEGTNEEFYKHLGMKIEDVEKSETDGNWYLKEKCPRLSEEEKLKKERERISMLSLTAADVERAIYQDKGMDFDDILAFISSNQPEGLDIKALKIELKANNFYRGNPYVEQIGKLLGYTSDDLDYLFENKELPEKEVKE